MAWTASIESKQRVGEGRLRVVVRFVNGAQTIDKEYIIGNEPIDINSFKNQVKLEAAKLESSTTLEQSLSVGNIDLSNPTPTPPTQAQVDLQTFLEDVEKLDKINRAISLGILTGNEAFVVNLREKIKNDFKLAYLDKL